MFELKKNIQNLWILGALTATTAFGGIIGEKSAQQGDQKAANPEVVTNTTEKITSGRHFPRSPKWKEVVTLYETNLVDKATNEPIYFMRNKVKVTSTTKMFAYQDGKFEKFVEDLLDRGDICTRKGSSSTHLTFDKPNKKYPWKTRHGFKERIFYEGPISDFPALKLGAGRVLTDFPGVTNGWSKTDTYNDPALIHTHSLTNIINDELKRYISTEIDMRRDERKPGKIKVKYGVVTLETKQDSYPQELNEIKQKTVYTIQDLGNDKVQVKGVQKGRNLHFKETQCWVLSDWRKVKKGKVVLPFPSSIRKVTENRDHLTGRGQNTR